MNANVEEDSDSKNDSNLGYNKDRSKYDEYNYSKGGI